MKLHREIKHKGKVCRAQDLGSYAQGEGHKRVKVNVFLTSCLSNNSKTAEAHLIKLHRKIKHNKKVCHAQELISQVQDEGHNQASELKACLCNN